MNEHELYSQGLDLEKAGKEEQALEVYQKVLELYPDHTGALNGRTRVINYLKRKPALEEAKRLAKQMAIHYTMINGKKGCFNPDSLHNGKKGCFNPAVDTWSIDLSDRNIVSIDLAPLNLYPRLSVFNLSNNQFKVIDFTPLKSCDELISLDLSSNQLESINLEPLRSCPNLERLYLQNNLIENIDLAPLRFCSKLSVLHLNSNPLQNIDLGPLVHCPLLLDISLNNTQLSKIDFAPLSSCINLETIRLFRNRIQSVDLTPLASCISLQTLDLRSNQLQSIDLSPLYSPLRSCEYLMELGLKGNQFKLIDLTPLSFKAEPNITWYEGNAPAGDIISWISPNEYFQSTTIYNHPPQKYPWSFLSEIAHHIENLRVQHDFLMALGLGDYGFIDCDLTEEFIAIPPETSTEIARDIITKKLVKEIMNAVDRDGHTTGFNLELLINKHAEIAKRAPNIIKLREREIECIIIEDQFGGYPHPTDLRALWLTAYGHQILSALNLGLITYSSRIEFRSIINAFADAGYELNLASSSINTVSNEVNMSNELKDCIWWIVENRGRSWNKILGD